MKCWLTSLMQQKSLSLPKLTSPQKEELNCWLDQRNSDWWSAVQDIQSIEAAALAEQEAKWLAETEYYQDLYLYADKL